MYAIVDIAGQQFKVKKDQKIFVHRLEGEVGIQVDFDRVLLIDNDTKVSVGAPVIEGAMISAKILEHLKGDKVIVFKKRRRKGYRVKNGHRQYMTQILIEDIVETGAKPKVAVEKKPVAAKAAEPKRSEEAKPKAAVKDVVEAKPVAEKKVAAAKKPTAEKAPAAKKPAAKKPTAEKPAAKKPAAPKKTGGSKK
jgi:large subunit ribosomal protein L21